MLNLGEKTCYIAFLYTMYESLHGFYQNAKRLKLAVLFVCFIIGLKSQDLKN